MIEFPAPSALDAGAEVLAIGAFLPRGVDDCVLETTQPFRVHGLVQASLLFGLDTMRPQGTALMNVVMACMGKECHNKLV